RACAVHRNVESAAERAERKKKFHCNENEKKCRSRCKPLVLKSDDRKRNAAPAPPNATKSMMVVLASCMTRTFIVILRNSSAFSFILICRAASALKIFNSFSPCTLSRKPSPIEVYLPQYFANIFLPYLDTATMDTG